MAAATASLVTRDPGVGGLLSSVLKCFLHLASLADLPLSMETSAAVIGTDPRGECFSFRKIDDGVARLLKIQQVFSLACDAVDTHSVIVP